jgi:hypothetical protein
MGEPTEKDDPLDAGQRPPNDAGAGSAPHQTFRAVDAGECKPLYKSVCEQAAARTCCCYDDCTFFCCGDTTDQVCTGARGAEHCYAACASQADCDAGAMCLDGACVPQGCTTDEECSDGGLKCQAGACVVKPCESNRDCGEALVCSISGTCGRPLEQEPTPGCSATGAGGTRAVLLVALLFAAARARRAHAPVRKRTPRRSRAPRA